MGQEATAGRKPGANGFFSKIPSLRWSKYGEQVTECPLCVKPCVSTSGVMGDNQLVNHIAAFIYAYGYLGVFSLLMLGIVGLPVPDEWLLTFAGYLVFKGHFHIVPTLAAVVLGSICGISVSYWLGHTLGIVFVRRYGPWFHITEERIGRVHAWFDRSGRWSLLIGYFVPGIRHLAGFVAGTSKLRFPEFALFAYTGAFVWSVSFVAIGYFSGKEWESTTRTIHRDIIIGAVLAATMVLAYMFFIRNPRRKE